MTFRIKIFISLIIILLGVSGCRDEMKSAKSYAPAMVVSVASDGEHVLTSHRDLHIVLWNVKDKTKKNISTNGNIYSAYFIRNTDMFIWQDLEDVVHIQKVNGEEVKTFRHFSTYGHVMTSDLTHYFSADAGWNLFYNYGDNLRKIRQGAKDKRSGPMFGKLYNLSLSDNGKYLVTAGDGNSHDADLSLEEQSKVLYEGLYGVAIWDIATLKPIANLIGNSAKTNATISPDGNYVVSGCENAQSYMLEVPSYKKHRLASIYDGVWKSNGVYDDSGMIPKPKEIKHAAILTLKFIKDSEYYFRFFTYEPYVGLFSTKSPFPLKYLPLGSDPFPSVNAYARNAAIDTAPAVGILVTGQAKGGGINVYKYHPDKQELERIWVAE